MCIRDRLLIVGIFVRWIFIYNSHSSNLALKSEKEILIDEEDEEDGVTFATREGPIGVTDAECKSLTRQQIYRMYQSGLFELPVNCMNKIKHLLPEEQPKRTSSIEDRARRQTRIAENWEPFRPLGPDQPLPRQPPSPIGRDR
eukprot:TRINITY_DN8662_c0_g1_i2.p1 TRINITY_DN8662_c0_g1~~TRINITY_DN8662_c0_g1_i2.p1  ORF type:complete len:143 (+),score=29.80 TRINITY_DN8662_c0_g1_i2:66-494(+)